MTLPFLLLVLLLGFFVHRIFSSHSISIGDFGLFWLLGLGSLTTIFFYINFNLGFKLDFRLILISLLLLFYILLKLTKKQLFNIVLLPSISKASRLVLILVLLFTSYPIIMLLYWPPFTPDAISLYEFRAQLMLKTGDFSFLSQIDPGTLAYPPLTSLGHYFLYSMGSETPNWLYIICLFSLLIVVFDLAYYYSHSSLASSLAVLGTLLTPVFYWTSFLSLSTLVFAIFFTAAVACILKQHYYLAALFLGFSSFVRGEPFWLGAMLIFILSIIKQGNIKTILAFFIIFFSLSSIWPGFSKSTRSYIPIAVIKTETKVLVNRVTKTQFNSSVNFSLPVFYSAWNILPLLSLLVVMQTVFIDRKNMLLHLSAPILALTLISGFIVFSFHNPEWNELNDSLYRLAILPIPLFWISFVNSLIKFPHD